jgi:hypothetical protein
MATRASGLAVPHIVSQHFIEKRKHVGITSYVVNVKECGPSGCMGSISSMALRNASTLSSSVANLVQVFSRDKKCSRASGIAASVASSA